MTHPRIEGGAKIPVTAVPHWEGNGWVKTDPPPKPARPTKTTPPVTEEPPVEDKKPEPKKAPARRANKPDTEEN